MADITKEFATVSSSSGVGDYTCQVTCQQNPSTTSREVQFTIRTASGVEKILIVTQEGKQTIPYYVETSGTFTRNPGVSASDRPTLSALFEGMGDNEQVVWSKKIALPQEGGTISLSHDELELDKDFLGTNFAGLRVTLVPQDGFTRKASYLANPIQVKVGSLLVASKGNQVMSLNTPVTIPVVNAYTWAAEDTMSVTMSLTEQSVQPDFINIIVNRDGQYIPDSDLDSGGEWFMYARLKTDSGEIPDTSSDGLLIGTLNNDLVGGGSLIGEPYQLQISRNFEGALLQSIEVRIVPTDVDPQPIGDPSSYNFHVECDVISNASSVGSQMITADVQGNSAQDMTLTDSIMVNDALSLTLAFDVTYSNR